MIIERRAGREFRRMRVPRGTSCSLCSRPSATLIVVTRGQSDCWTGFCERCVDELAAAAEESVETNWAKAGGVR